jgi:hypothetical protein
MNDKEFIEYIEKAKTCKEILSIMMDNEEYLTYDPYYRDFRVAMINTARKILDWER